MEKLDNESLKELPEKEHQLAREIVEYSLQKRYYQGHKIKGNILVAYFCEPARYLKYDQDGEAIVEDPKEENAYIGIAIHHAETMHFLDRLSVSVKVFDASNKLIGVHPHPFHARPGLHNYGHNWKLPGDGLYNLHVTVEITQKQREEMVECELPTGICEVIFHNIKIVTGKHVS